jgi:AcrR family transcriptional regulator
MSPRKYDMTRRASAAAQTRQRIIESTRALHGERGIAATSWDQIAARAGVGVGTVYRHFPSLDELIPACGAQSMEVIAPPAPAVVAGAANRVGRLVREAFGMYERGGPQIRAMRNEFGFHPAVAAAGEELDAALSELVEAAGVAPGDRAIVRAMIDFGTWQALRDQGLGPEEAADAVADMLAARLADG